ncbi:hypothetical protein MASR2M29_05600 [Spirochaetota bacterium]
MKKIAVFLVFAGLFAAMFAGAQEASFKNNLSFTASSIPEAKMNFSHTTILPFLRGDGALVSGNSLALNFDGEFSPVSVGASAEARITPIAFLQFFAGGSIASGWNVPGLAEGLRKNHLVAATDAELVGEAFDGFVWSLEGGGLFQFDMAAIFPGDWNHVVFQTSHLARYKSLSSAEKDESWLFQADSGENRNGWNYYGNYFLGYQMPIFLQMAGVLLEEDLYLYDTPGRNLWGDDLGRWTLAAVLSFKIFDGLSANLITQFSSRRNFTEASKDYEFYQKRILDTANPLRLEFYRVAAIVSWDLAW